MNPPTYLPRFAGALVFTSQSGQFLFQQERNRFYLVHLTLLGIGEPGEFLSTSKDRLSISALGFEKHTGSSSDYRLLEHISNLRRAMAHGSGDLPSLVELHDCQ